MQVEILNPDTVINLYKNHGQFACVCYNTPEEKAEMVGKSCVDSGHMSGSRCEYIKFRVTGVDRGTAEQSLRQEVGVYVPFEHQDNYLLYDEDAFTETIPSDQMVKNMASFRYIDKHGFKWAIPSNIRKIPKACARYNALMNTINRERNEIMSILTDNGIPKHKANEDVSYVLPRATTTEFVIGFTPEAFLTWCRKRLCSRAQERITLMAKKMVKSIEPLNPDFAARCVPSCEYYLWCPEGKHTCGRYPTKNQLKEKLKETGVIV